MRLPTPEEKSSKSLLFALSKASFSIICLTISWVNGSWAAQINEMKTKNLMQKLLDVPSANIRSIVIWQNLRRPPGSASTLWKSILLPGFYFASWAKLSSKSCIYKNKPPDFSNRTSTAESTINCFRESRVYTLIWFISSTVKPPPTIFEIDLQMTS